MFQQLSLHRVTNKFLAHILVQVYLAMLQLISFTVDSFNELKTNL
jgi:hypothetical protein